MVASVVPSWVNRREACVSSSVVMDWAKVMASAWTPVLHCSASILSPPFPFIL